MCRVWREEVFHVCAVCLPSLLEERQRGKVNRLIEGKRYNIACSGFAGLVRKIGTRGATRKPLTQTVGRWHMKILNLYAGIGGNRRLWSDVEVTAVEMNPDIVKVYSDFYPQDTVIVGDAHQYLLEHYKEFDFIWSSPPCPTHGQYRFNVGVRAKGYKGVYPDMKLYEEIIFLQYHFEGYYAVENVVSYYEPLIKPQKIGRHYIWANYEIPPLVEEAQHIRSKNKISDFDVDLSGYKLSDKRQVLRNCVSASLGQHVLHNAPNKACNGFVGTVRGLQAVSTPRQNPAPQQYLIPPTIR